MSIGNGRKTYSDSTLKSMTKDELIDIIRCLESNIRNAYEENDIQYENCKRLLSEERNKTLDEIVNQIDEFQDFLSGGEYDYFPEDDDLFVYDRDFKPGDTVQHFKGGFYKIVAIGTNTETEEKMVVYQSLKDKRVWIRPYEMFISKVDREKYPNADQSYRLIKVKITV